MIKILCFLCVFKSKFFPTGSVFYAESFVGSYAWQSILKARKVTAAGMLWRVGNGECIQLYVDNWLPGGSSLRILSPRVDELKNSMVARLWIPHQEGGIVF